MEKAGWAEKQFISLEAEAKNNVIKLDCTHNKLDMRLAEIRFQKELAGPR